MSEAAARPVIKSARVDFVDAGDHNDAVITAQASGARSVSLVLQTAGGYSRRRACDPSAWHLRKPAPRLRFHRVKGRNLWRWRGDKPARAMTVLGSEVQLFHFTAKGSGGTAHTTFTRDACTA
jgi:hypothetical protein